MKLYFITKNNNKISEMNSLLKDTFVEIKSRDISIEEIQTSDYKKLVLDKCLKAFSKVQKPLFLEHTCLCIEEFDGYPGGLTETFWNSLGGDNISKYFGGLKVMAKTIIGYCDGKDILYFEGEVEGVFSNAPKGDSQFQWDTVFIPKGYEQTFAEMGNKKNEISMRKLAIDKFIKYLKGS